jgi:MYXO-CTERM domain-containing protein
VTFSSTTTSVCTVSGSTVSVVSRGTCTIQADQAGDANYDAAAPVTRSFAVTKAAQSITFPELASFAFSQGGAMLAATASSGLPVRYTVLSGPCAESDGVLTASAVGTCVVAADQAGDDSFGPAAQVSRTVEVTAEAQHGCGCGSTGPGGLAELLLGVGLVALRRRRRQGREVAAALPDQIWSD